MVCVQQLDLVRAGYLVARMQRPSGDIDAHVTHVCHNVCAYLPLAVCHRQPKDTVCQAGLPVARKLVAGRQG